MWERGRGGARDNLAGGTPSPESPRQPFDSPVDRPSHESNSHKQNKPDGIKNDEVHHGNSPKSDKDNISKSSGNNKFSTTPPAGGGHPKPPLAPSGSWKATTAQEAVQRANQTLETQSKQLEEVKKSKTRIKFGGIANLALEEGA